MKHHLLNVPRVFAFVATVRGKIQSKRLTIIHLTQVALVAAVLSVAASPTAHAAEYRTGTPGQPTISPPFISALAVMNERSIRVEGPSGVQTNEEYFDYPFQLVKYSVQLLRYYDGFGWSPYCHRVDQPGGGSAVVCDGFLREYPYLVAHGFGTHIEGQGYNFTVSPGISVQTVTYSHLQPGHYSVKLKLEWFAYDHNTLAVTKKLGEIRYLPSSVSDFEGWDSQNPDGSYKLVASAAGWLRFYGEPEQMK